MHDDANKGHPVMDCNTPVNADVSYATAKLNYVRSRGHHRSGQVTVQKTTLLILQFHTDVPL